MAATDFRGFAPSLRRLALTGVTAAALVAAQVAAASAASIGFIRDAEIESLLADYARPIIRTAGVGESAVNIYLVSSQSFNAFVADGRRIFVNAGVLMQADTPGEVIGVLAHETGHIAGGHLARMGLELSNASALAAIATILGAGAVAAGAATGSGAGGQAGQAVMMGGNHVAQRLLMKYQRSEEAAADQAAVNYLNATGQSAKGMLRTFERLADQAVVSARYTDPYAVSHPMPRDRIAALENLARKSPYFDTPAPAALQQRHDLSRAKLYGYMSHPSSVERRYPRSDNSAAAHYARAIAAMRAGNFSRAIDGMDALIKASPQYAYFWEAKGDFLVRAGRPAQAIEPLRRAHALAPGEPLIQIELGQALVSSNEPALLDEAIALLSEGVRKDPEYGSGFRSLAMAYGRKGQIPEADLATAQGHLADGNVELAKRFAQRAKQGLKTGSPGWLKADDILSVKPPRS